MATQATGLDAFWMWEERGRELAEGQWQREEDAAAAFDSAISSDARFGSVYREVRGVYLSRSPFEPEKAPRIDRVLVPSPELIGAGWKTGPVGVEIKASLSKIGPPISQCLDYSRAVFEIKPGFRITLGFVFLFPFVPQQGPLASIMAQNRIGTCAIGSGGYLRFRRDQEQKISLTEPKRNEMPNRKVGSR